MAHSPAVLAAYTSLRAVIAEHGTFDPKVGAALTLATAVTVGNGYMIAIASRLAQMSGWAEAQVVALRRGTPTSDAKIDLPAGLVREAAANSGNVTDGTWQAAQRAGWSDEQLTNAFAYLGLTVFTGYFLNYAQTDMDALWQIERSGFIGTIVSSRTCLGSADPPMMKPSGVAKLVGGKGRVRPKESGCLSREGLVKLK
jgi:hypothetical protein